MGCSLVYVGRIEDLVLRTLKSGETDVSTDRHRQNVQAARLIDTKLY